MPTAKIHQLGSLRTIQNISLKYQHGIFRGTQGLVEKEGGGADLGAFFSTRPCQVEGLSSSTRLCRVERGGRPSSSTRPCRVEGEGRPSSSTRPCRVEGEGISPFYSAVRRETLLLSRRRGNTLLFYSAVPSRRRREALLLYSTVSSRGRENNLLPYAAVPSRRRRENLLFYLVVPSRRRRKEAFFSRPLGGEEMGTLF